MAAGLKKIWYNATYQHYEMCMVKHGKEQNTLEPCIHRSPWKVNSSWKALV